MQSESCKGVMPKALSLWEAVPETPWLRCAPRTGIGRVDCRSRVAVAEGCLCSCTAVVDAPPALPPLLVRDSIEGETPLPLRLNPRPPLPLRLNSLPPLPLCLASAFATPMLLFTATGALLA